MIKKIGMFKPIQNFIKKTENPAFYNKVNNILPLTETLFATTCYAVAIQKNKTIEKERKPSMHWQNIICGGAGILLSSSLNKFINKHKQALCLELEKRNIVKVGNIIRGVQMAVPLIITSAMLRFIIPVISTPISTWLVHKQKKVNKS